jgi:hypothetical protein
MLEHEIEQSLLLTAQWTPAWFNKPKFHLIFHLPSHIRRFGPPIPFATEGFETFNAVIRAKSIHSNRQAPSRDIACAFAQGNRVRHLISGGFFQVPISGDEENKFSTYPSRWRRAGPKVLALVSKESRSTARSYLGLNRAPRVFEREWST